MFCCHPSADVLNCKIGQNIPSPKRTSKPKVSHVLTILNAYALALSVCITAGHVETHRLVPRGKAKKDLEEQLLTCDIGLEFLLFLEVVWPSGYSLVHKGWGFRVALPALSVLRLGCFGQVSSILLFPSICLVLFVSP